MADISAKFEKNLDSTSFSRELPQRTELQNCHCDTTSKFSLKITSCFVSNFRCKINVTNINPKPSNAKKVQPFIRLNKLHRE